MTRVADAAWAAGLFEGEGSVAVSWRGGRAQAKLTLGTTDLDVLERHMKIVGRGSIGTPRQGVNKPQHTWQTGGWPAFFDIWDMFAPWLGERRKARFCEIGELYDPCAAPGQRQREKTHCPHGHAYNAENTVIDTRGARKCRICVNGRQRLYHAAKKATTCA